MALLVSLLRIAAVLVVASAAGWVMGGALVPRGRDFLAERLGWSYAVGCAVLVAFVPLSLALGTRPTWIAFLALAAALVAASRLLAPLAAAPHPAEGRGERRMGGRMALLLVAIGVAVYALRALTEPMWANDYIAIWGLKGKTIFGAAGFPERLRSLEFAHPEYPLGLPLLYAGISFLLGRWDDHALALAFPLLQVATLLVLFGWLRRRGASPAVAGLAAAVVAWFEPLYSGFLTGMAEVPLAFALLLLGTALADALEDTDGGALRRLAFAAALCAATKNEGLFVAAAATILALVFGKARRGKVALAILAPAFLVRAAHLPWRSRVPLADFDASLFSLAGLWDSLAAAILLVGGAAWTGIALVLVLVALGRRAAAGGRLLLLVAGALAAYLVVPAFAVRGPAWLIETTLLRTTAALAPLAAAAVSVRFSRT